MNGDKALNIVGGILTIALVTTVVARPNSVLVIREIASGFTKAVMAAMGAGQNFGK